MQWSWTYSAHDWRGWGWKIPFGNGSEYLGSKHGMEVLRGNCFESDRMLPFGPILDLLRGYTKADTAKELKSLATELVKRLLDVRVPSPEIQPLSSLHPAQEKKQYFQTLDELFIENASGLLLIVEDLHWCDDTSLEFLLHFARQISTTPILLLLTYHNDEVQSSLVHFLAVLDQARLASELTLDRLLQAKQVHLMGKASFPICPSRRKTLFPKVTE